MDPIRLSDKNARVALPLFLFLLKNRVHIFSSSSLFFLSAKERRAHCDSAMHRRDPHNDMMHK